jgi:choline/glycine/proline betaine transport protein
MLTNGGHEQSPLWQRVFWSVIEGATAATLLLAGGLGALQTATIAAALPFTVVMLLMCWGLVRALRIELVKRESLRDARVGPRGPHAALGWQQRLRTMIHQPKQAEVAAFIANTVKPALTGVVDELKKQGREARINSDETDGGRVWVEVLHGEEIDFFYAVHPRAYEPPSFVMRDTRADRADKLKYYRAEVHLREGGQDYDIMSWSNADIIDDVLDQYERHLHFLDVVR